MSNINPQQIYFPTLKGSNTSQFKLDIKEMVDAADTTTERQLRQELDFMLEEIETQGTKSMHAHAVSPHNDAWFVFIDVIHDTTIALYAFVDKHNNIQIYHANRQKTASPLMSLLSDGLKIAKTL